MSRSKSSTRKRGRKTKQRRYDPFVASFQLRAGDRVQIRRSGERKWLPHRIRRDVSMRTTKRVKDTLYMEYLGFEVRFTAPFIQTERRFTRY